MDLKLLLSTFGVVFLAELGDKTQLAVLGMAAGGKSKAVVFAGAALALVAASGLAVLVGDGLSRVIRPVWLERFAGVLFLVLGAFYLYPKR